jgi:hypothetical protein
MNKLSHLPTAIQNLLKDSARQAGFDSGFVQRRSKLSAEVFVQTLTFGWLANPSASLQQLAQTAAIFGSDISAQAFDQRFTQQAASCLRQVLQAAVEQAIASDPVAIPVLRRFKRVELIDTTIIGLPDELLQVWTGCGGTLGESSSLKIELGLDLLTGRLDGPHLHDGRTADSRGVLQHANLGPGSLRLCDLAYFKLRFLKELSHKGVYWITRLKACTGIVDQKGKRWKLLDFLRAQSSDRIEVVIKIGFNEQIECRLLAVKVSKQTAERRRRRVRDKARRNCSTPKKQTLALAEWTVLVTNVESEKLSLDEVLVMARVRWQIELLFKLWKSQGQVDLSRSKKPWRILCEIYAKLLAMLIQHWIVVVSGWRYADRSLLKAGKVVQMLALCMATAIESTRGLMTVTRLIERCIAKKCRVGRRKKAPSSFQLLLNDALA